MTSLLQKNPFPVGSSAKLLPLPNSMPPEGKDLFRKGANPR
jgi:hypothetical protein